MSALITLLGFALAATAVAAGFRVWEKRSKQAPGQAPDLSSPSDPSKLLIHEPAASNSTLPAASSPPQLTPAIAPPDSQQLPSAPAPSVSPSPVVTPPIIPDPWLSEDELAFDTVPPGQVLPFSETFVNHVAESSAVTPATTSRSVPLGTPELSQRILSLGKSGQFSQVANLTRYAGHSDSSVRAAVATALGNLAFSRRGIGVEALIPVLARLSQDSKVDVRVAAVQALGYIRSNQVLPWLQRAQRSSNGRVNRAATIALQPLKLGYQPKSTAASVQKKPRNR